MKGVRIQFYEGQRFGALTVVRVHPGGPNRPRSIECRCDCGRDYFVASVRLNRGEVKRCFQCAPWRRTPEEIAFRRRLHGYRASAERKSLPFEFTDDEFRKFYEASCIYCGASPARGIDRKDNNLGYVRGNGVPCCSLCNYAKRNLTIFEFLNWVARIAAKQGFSL